MNTQRSPLGGRAFESFSEDPVLNGLIAAAYINGLQSKGVSATIKHYVANDQEFERFSISSMYRPRSRGTLHRTELPSRRRERTRIEGDIPKALPDCHQKVKSMGSYDSVGDKLFQGYFPSTDVRIGRYNRINGVHVSENEWILNDILRKVTTDFAFPFYYLLTSLRNGVIKVPS